MAGPIDYARLKGELLEFSHATPPRAANDTPAKLSGRMKRRWRVVLLRAKGKILGTVEAPDVAAAKVAVAVRFELEYVQRDRIIVQELV